jgi:hypothetical protein
MTALEREKLIALLPYIGKFKGIAMLTAEPMEGLSEQVRRPAWLPASLPERGVVQGCQAGHAEPPPLTKQPCRCCRTRRSRSLRCWSSATRTRTGCAASCASPTRCRATGTSERRGRQLCPRLTAPRPGRLGAARLAVLQARRVPLAQAAPVHWRLDLSAPAARPPPLLRRWGQQPTLYKATWKRFTSILRAHTQYATMLWAPNEGGGYPYAGGCDGAQVQLAPKLEPGAGHLGELSAA